MRRFARPFRQVRVRATLAATLVGTVAFVIAGFALVTVMQAALTSNTDGTLELRAADIVALVEAGTPPESISIPSEEGGFVQLIGRDGTVLAASTNVLGEPPIASLADDSYRTVVSHPLGSHAFRLHAARSRTEPPVFVLVGVSLEDNEGIVRAVTAALGIGLPILLGLIGAMTWVLVGRALRPVDLIRSEVAGISTADLHRRVPDPASGDEISRLAHTMNEMLHRLEQGNERERRFVSDASHELRSPIAAIRHELEIALGHPDETDWPAVGSGLLQEGLRMQQLVDDLLWLARHDQQPPSARRDLVDLDDFALDEARRARDGISVDVSDLSAGQVRGDREELRRVVRNLVDNACRHARHRVRIEIVDDGNEVELRVDDDGPGVPRVDRERIFERFTRRDDARSRDAGGAGLGLAIAREIAVTHGGSVEITESPALGGARFTLRLPSSEDAPQEVRSSLEPGDR